MEPPARLTFARAQFEAVTWTKLGLVINLDDQNVPKEFLELLSALFPFGFR